MKTYTAYIDKYRKRTRKVTIKAFDAVEAYVIAQSIGPVSMFWINWP